MNKPETTPPTYFHHIRDGTPGGYCCREAHGHSEGKAMSEVTKARAKVREQERTIWNRVEAAGREARAADGAAKLSASMKSNTETKREKQAQTLGTSS